jgi:fucose permease
LEVTTSLWASSYFVEKWQFSPEAAAGFASMFYIGITFGRFINGFFAMKLSDHFLIRAGCALITVGIGLLFIPVSSAFALVGFVIIGLGCAPIYPCIIHMTPDVFGKDKSQAMIGIQMAFAYTGFLIIPPLFGVIADYITISLLPVFQLALLAAMFLTHEMVVRKNKNG